MNDPSFSLAEHSLAAQHAASATSRHLLADEAVWSGAGHSHLNVFSQKILRVSGSSQRSLWYAKGIIPKLLPFADIESLAVINLDELQLFRFVSQKLINRFVASRPWQIVVVIDKDDVLGAKAVELAKDC